MHVVVYGNLKLNHPNLYSRDIHQKSQFNLLIWKTWNNNYLQTVALFF